jgi:hypothetical protein
MSLYLSQGKKWHQQSNSNLLVTMTSACTAAWISFRIARRHAVAGQKHTRERDFVLTKPPCFISCLAWKAVSHFSTLDLPLDIAFIMLPRLQLRDSFQSDGWLAIRLHLKFITDTLHGRINIAKHPFGGHLCFNCCPCMTCAHASSSSLTCSWLACGEQTR